MKHLTGKPFSSRPASNAYRDNYDRVFGRRSAHVRRMLIEGSWPDLAEGLRAKPKPKRRKP